MPAGDRGSCIYQINIQSKMMDMSKGFDHSTSSNIRNIRNIKSPETEFNGFKSRAVFKMSVVKPKPK